MICKKTRPFRLPAKRSFLACALLIIENRVDFFTAEKHGEESGAVLRIINREV